MNFNCSYGNKNFYAFSNNNNFIFRAECYDYLFNIAVEMKKLGAL